MKQAIVILLKPIKEIQQIRKKYDPGYKKFKPHITLAFPFKNINQKELQLHIKNSLTGVKSFNLELKGIRKSPKEYYLYLLIKTGKGKILKIHKSLYSELLTKQLRKNIPYIPHITLGVFGTKKQINEAINEIKKEKINFKTKIKAIKLLTLNKDDSIKKTRSFKLK